MKHLSVSRCREQRWRRKAGRWEWTRGGKKGKTAGMQAGRPSYLQRCSTFGQLPGNGVLDNSWGWVDVALLSQQAVAEEPVSNTPSNPHKVKKRALIFYQRGIRGRRQSRGKELAYKTNLKRTRSRLQHYTLTHVATPQNARNHFAVVCPCACLYLLHLTVSCCIFE